MGRRNKASLHLRLDGCAYLFLSTCFLEHTRIILRVILYSACSIYSTTTWSSRMITYLYLPESLGPGFPDNEQIRVAVFLSYIHTIPLILHYLDTGIYRLDDGVMEITEI